MEFSSIIIIVILAAVTFVIFKFIVNPLLKLLGVILLFVAILYVLKYYFNVDINQSVHSYSSQVDIDGFLEKIHYFVDLIMIYLNHGTSFFKK